MCINGNGKMEDNTVNGKELGPVDQQGIFHSLSPLLFIVAEIPLTAILNKTNHVYEISKGAGRISHLLYMDDLNLYTKTEVEMNQSFIHWK